MSADVVYLDSSALVKLVVAEPESAALRQHLNGSAVRVTSALARVEVVRAVSGAGSAAVARAREVLTRLDLLTLDDALLDAAADLADSGLRSLDAIHIASAQAFGDDLAALVTYDHRMATSARDHGMTVTAPA